MNNAVSKVIDRLNCCDTYCCSILNKPSGVYTVETTMITEVIQDYVKECLRLLKDE